MFAIEGTGILKSFGKKEVLKGIDLKITRGSIHAYGSAEEEGPG